ncbi:hypothetical protein ACOMHN_058772 [Nucella lapillus]
MLPGFELLFSSVQPQLRSSQDAVVSAIHWAVVSAGFKLTGVGENPSGEKQCTEVLLHGWNDAEIYVFHYQSASQPTQHYLLKALPVDDSLLLHFQKEDDENVTTLELPVKEFASDDLSSVTTVFRNMDRLNSTVRKSLVDPAMGSNSSTAGTDNPGSTSSAGETKEKKKRDKKKSPLMVEEHRPQHQPRPMQPAWYREEGGGGGFGMDPFSVGRSDLDPLAGLGGMGGGGMIMDPRHSGGPRFGPEAGGRFGGGPAQGGGIHPSGLPPGAIPPGARFDPIGPAGTRAGPDPDHEVPPGYDDMYM